MKNIHNCFPITISKFTEILKLDIHEDLLLVHLTFILFPFQLKHTWLNKFSVLFV